MSEEQVPVNAYIHVIKAITIYKTAKWWQAVVLGESNGKKHIGIYLWQKQESQWKRKHKFQLNRKTDYPPIHKAIEDLIGELS
jgi:hypothetical protein